MNPIVRDVNINLNLDETCNTTCRCLPFGRRNKKKNKSEGIEEKIDAKAKETLDQITQAQIDNTSNNAVNIRAT